ncbi:T161A protein, partial [Columbina picui]|nr:T161A protein [Columbina picui]
MGVQVVVTLLAASVMQKMAPHCSFARWLLCNGSLRRYKHPSDEELCALAGKQRPKTKRDRRVNGVTDDKPLSVPRDIDLRLDTSPITAVDALVLRYFLEYQWFVDFAVYSTAVYIFTEGYYCLADPQRETNMGVLWCLLTVVFSIKVFFTVMRHYFRSEEGGERSVCLTFAFFFLLLAMVALVIREDYLEFGLEPGLASVTSNLENTLKQQGWEWTLPIAKLTFKLGLVALCSFLGACLTFSGHGAGTGVGEQLDSMTLKVFPNQNDWVICSWPEPNARSERAGHHPPAHLQCGAELRCGDRPPQLCPFCHTGHHSWGLYPEPPPLPPVAPAAPPHHGGEDGEDVHAAVEQITGILGGIFTPLFCRGLFAFLTWWVAACQVVTSLFGLYFHQYLAAS